MKHQSKNNNSIINLIDTGIVIWIKSLCNYIKEISIEIKELKLGILTHKIKGLKLNASNLSFKNIIIEEISLEADQLNIELDLFNKANGIISVKNKFKLWGDILLNQDGVNLILQSKECDWI